MDYDSARRFQDWWGSIVPRMPIDGVRALWFGLVELVQRDIPRWELYVVGCGQFDPDDSTGDWATDIVWQPPERYVFLPELQDLASQPYQVMLQRAAQILGERAPETSWPGTLDGVAVGYDDGDFEVTWTRTGRK